MTSEAWGWLAAFGAVSMWAGWAVATRLLLGSATLDPADIVALRFLTAAALMLPYAAARPPPVRRLTVPTLAAIIAGSGFAFSLCNTGGLVFAPAAHSGAMTSPLGAVFTGLLAHGLIGERLRPRSVLGLTMIAGGATAIVLASLGGAWGGRSWIGHLLFTAAGLLWAGYNVTARGARLAALDAVAISTIGSALVYLPPYLLLAGPRFLAAPWREIAIQAALHGGVGATLSIFVFNLGLIRLGAARAAAAGALTPILTALAGVAVLGEVPSPPEAAGMAVLTAGVWLASGARLASADPLAPRRPGP
ncbi:DMT family transporter [Elioraea sp.]|uniref:DMT family transporter n=1 Tax=Elioraea sp. TaxID=2185103 RepID=UPI003F6EE709